MGPLPAFYCKYCRGTGVYNNPNSRSKQQYKLENGLKNIKMKLKDDYVLTQRHIFCWDNSFLWIKIYCL